MEVEHPDPQFDGFYVHQSYDALHLRANEGYKLVKHSAKAPPALWSKKREEYMQRYKESLDEKVAEAKCVKNNAKNLEHYYARKASMTVEEKMAKRSKEAVMAREWLERFKDDPDFKKRKSMADKRYRVKKKAARDQAKLSSSHHTLDM
ncbi:uncharacterized protein UBRO_20571 [Ustilago bromivora]|uniref:Uncharacterized protein n=1 Tax=Ustilago bromivora TaxID=307758 RepID=A0A1K0GM57_9BASI|nr:uncharacterized protein UBRO_20571 [Ustilago bromivora]